jgi:hypothetical protein
VRHPNEMWPEANLAILDKNVITYIRYE